jgi:excinuclease ABC subunit C
MITKQNLTKQNHPISIKIKQGLVPTTSGVYKMLGEAGKVLYVGKAKNLLNRLKSYLQYCNIEGDYGGENYIYDSKFSPKTKRLISLVKNIEIITTSSESHALILEASLIKALFPPYNILLKDGKSLPYIALSNFYNQNFESTNQKSNPKNFPLLFQHRGKKSSENKYFGPYGGSDIIFETIDLIQKLFNLRTCSDNEFKTRSRPCLKYQIKMCSAPCVAKISPAEYKESVKKASDFLSGKNNDLKNDLITKMNTCSENLDYEGAIGYRNKIQALSKIQKKGDLSFSDFVDTDVVCILQIDGVFGVQVFYIKNGFSFGSNVFFPKAMDGDTKEDVLEAFLTQFYYENDKPKEILLNISLDNEFCDDFYNGIGCKLLHPKLGKKLELVNFTLSNLTNEITKHNNAKSKNMQNLILLKNFLDLEDIPKRIDVFDNSHTQGKDFIGAMIVATQDGFNKKEYRKYNVKFDTTKPGDDFAMIYEVLTRRYSSMTESNKPDLVVVDGGKGQMTMLKKAFEDLGIDLPFVCISKGVDRNAGNELFHTKNWTDRPLEKNSPLMFYMQNIRDEAHRFAIKTHREKRSKSFLKSEIDNIQSLGKKRKKDLLEHFGSVELLKKASIDDLKKVQGISSELATRIVKFFQ